MNQIICPNCQAANRRGANYCAACGWSLSNTPTDGIDEAPTLPKALPAEEAVSPDELQTAPLRGSFDLRVGRRTDVGRVRDSNEDSLLALELLLSNKSVGQPVGLFVVADGMGGHEGGEIASGMLVRVMARLAANEWLSRLTSRAGDIPDNGEWLSGAIQEGNDRVFEMTQQAGYGMGTTVVAALVVGDRGHIAHVGDSRAYRVNAAGIERLTTDHSLVESLVVANQISREQARDHPQANVIYRTIGDRPQVAIDINPIHLARGDALLLCSDGLTGMLADETIHRLAAGATSPQAACDALIDAANEAGGEDNSTVILIKLETLPPTGSDRDG
jgi:protein phosphatase